MERYQSPAWLPNSLNSSRLILLPLAMTAAGTLLLNCPTLAADASKVPPWSNPAAVRPMLPLAASTLLDHTRVIPIAEPGMPDVEVNVPETESLPVVGPAQPPTAEPVVELLEPPPPAQYKDLWERMRAGFALPDMKGQLVARHQAWYLNRPKYVRRMVKRSQRYLYFIVGELEKRNMPSEIALLPMIESAYNPHAYSRMQAAGIWQFIPATGRKYGLEQTFWYDGRRDVLAATRAALDYLQFLHDMFGDWQLALAAYNWGEGSVQRAIAHNRAQNKVTNYASLKMPNETRNYLPKLQAVKNILSSRKLLGLEPEAIPNEPYFAVVNTPGHMDVVKAAQLADMPVEEFRSLNPAYNRPVILQSAARQILLPIDKVDAFHVKLESNGDRLMTWQAYVMKKGETLSSVARKFNVSKGRLHQVNGLTGCKRIPAGQVLLVPIASGGSLSSLGKDDDAASLETLSRQHDAVRDCRPHRRITASRTHYKRHGDLVSTKSVEEQVNQILQTK
jgi:peptidoglycan lytic transglycosylase D